MLYENALLVLMAGYKRLADLLKLGLHFQGH